jgi:hypothetical protein
LTPASCHGDMAKVVILGFEAGLISAGCRPISETGP